MERTTTTDRLRRKTRAGWNRVGDRRGFTVVELMVVVAVTAILVAVMVPLYVSKLPEMRLTSAARSLVGDLRLARSLAVAHDTPYFVCFSGTGAYQIDRVDDPAGATDCASASTPTELSDDLMTRYAGVRYGFGAGAAGCPGGGAVADPVVFPSHRAVFSATGASVTGSGSGAPVQATGLIYLTNPDTSPQQTYCLEVQGTVGNVRLFRWDAAGGTWVQ